MTTAIDRAIQFAAGLLGAAGVAAAAGGAHGAAYPNLPTLAFILLVHAAAVLAVLALGAREHRGLPLYRIAAGVMLLGMLLFGGDLALRDLAGARLFPFAAPVGGAALIVGWVLSALLPLGR